MGQKVNPIGFRLGINRGWDSIWFSNKRDYGKLLIDLLLIQTTLCYPKLLRNGTSTYLKTYYLDIWNLFMK